MKAVCNGGIWENKLFKYDDKFVILSDHVEFHTDGINGLKNIYKAHIGVRNKVLKEPQNKS